MFLYKMAKNMPNCVDIDKNSTLIGFVCTCRKNIVPFLNKPAEWSVWWDWDKK